MRIAVLFSPGAGSNTRFHEIGSLLSERFVKHEVYTCRNFCGKFYMPGAIETGNDISCEYKDSVRNMTISLLEYAPELFICVGGDGLAAYIADTLIINGCRVPLMGIAGGTANVGPIISVEPGAIGLLDPEKLIFSGAGAIRVTNGCRHIGYAFNDVVIGNTFLGTVEGIMANLSVEELLFNNEKVVAEPSADISTDRFRITKNGRNVAFGIAKPGQIIVSPLEVDRFYGRAITGVLCNSAHLPLKAAIGLSDEVIVQMQGDSRELRFTKIEHLLFGPGDLVSISGLSGNGHIIVDGNPYLRAEESVSFEYIPDILKIAKPL